MSKHSCYGVKLMSFLAPQRLKRLKKIQSYKLVPKQRVTETKRVSSMTFHQQFSQLQVLLQSFVVQDPDQGSRATGSSSFNRSQW